MRTLMALCVLVCLAGCSPAPRSHCSYPNDEIGRFCTSDSQCSTGACASLGHYCVGACDWKPIVVGVGDRCDCANSCGTIQCLEQCPEGSYCKTVTVGVERRCLPLEASGYACSLNMNPCRRDLTCIPTSSDMTSGNCGPMPQAGERCDLLDRCADGLYCDQSTWPWFCRPQRQPGETCGPYSPCGDFLSCSVSCQNGLLCCSDSKLGITCTSTSDCSLDTGLFCSQVSHTCKPVLPWAAPCDLADSDEQCGRPGACDPTSKTCKSDDSGYCH